MNKKFVISILLSLILIFSRGVILSLVSATVTYFMFKYNSPSEVVNVLNQYSLIDYYLRTTLAILINILAGGIVGYNSKKFGWLYAGVIGMFTSLIYFKFAPLLIIQMIIGGFLGETYSKYRKKGSHIVHLSAMHKA